VGCDQQREKLERRSTERTAGASNSFCGQERWLLYAAWIRHRPGVEAASTDGREVSFGAWSARLEWRFGPCLLWMFNPRVYYRKYPNMPVDDKSDRQRK
jgi:hypothetical protein